MGQTWTGYIECCGQRTREPSWQAPSFATVPPHSGSFSGMLTIIKLSCLCTDYIWHRQQGLFWSMVLIASYFTRWSRSKRGWNHCCQLRSATLLTSNGIHQHLLHTCWLTDWSGASSTYFSVRTLLKFWLYRTIAIPAVFQHTEVWLYTAMITSCWNIRLN